MAEVVLLVAMIAVPLGIGAATAFLARPWWWGAVLAISVFLAAAILPTPEEGESRVAVGDAVFLVIVALVVAGLTWAGARAARRFRTPA